MHILRRVLHTTNKTKKATKLLKKNLNEKVAAHPNREVFFFDESRFGTHSKLGHGWFKKGIRTSVPVKLGFQNFYVYSAVAPKNGDDCTLLIPYVNSRCMNVFLKHMSESLGEKEVFLIMDGAGWHKSRTLVVPSNIEIIYLPAYSPELNPVERLWEYMKDHLIANKIYDSLGSLEKAVCEFIQKVTPDILQTVCAANYLSS